MLTGRCLCGNCTYEIDGEPIIVARCHCLDCQRLSGAGHTVGAMFADSGIRIAGTLTTYDLIADSGSTVTRTFCGRCGSPLFGQNTNMPGFKTVMMGTLDTSEGLTPQVAVFCRTRRSWDADALSISSFEAQPAWSPEDGA